MDDEQTYPTFNGVRLKHHISLEALAAAAGPSLSMEEIRLFDETGRANPYTADDLLFLLSELAGQWYTRSNVGGITLVLARPPMSPTQPQPQTGPLHEQPTLLELYAAYALDLEWLAEALVLETSEVWQLLAEAIPQTTHPKVAELLSLISRYTGRSYTLESVTLDQRAKTTQPLFSSRAEQGIERLPERSRTICPGSTGKRISGAHC